MSYPTIAPHGAPTISPVFASIAPQETCGAIVNDYDDVVRPQIGATMSDSPPPEAIEHLVTAGRLLQLQLSHLTHEEARERFAELARLYYPTHPRLEAI